MKINPSTRSPWMWVSLSALVLAGGVLVAPRLMSPDGGGVTVLARHGWSMLSGGAHEVQPALAHGTSEQGRPLDAVRAVVFGKGLLSQVQIAGDWAIDAQGKLKPDLALRKRFEHYLLALGDATPQELRALIEDEARKANGEQAAAAIMAIYDKYWALRNHQPSQRLVLGERGTWDPAFQELKSLRRQYLGQEWAEAFYKAEEDEFVRFEAQADSKGGPDKMDVNLPVPQMGPGKDAAAVHAERVALYGEAAAQRLAKADAEWAEWEARMNGAKAEWQRLQSSAELSDVQRQQAIDQYIEGHFPPDERMRAHGLLN